jgi:hypothetical protein
VPGDAIAAASQLDEFVIVGPEGDDDEAKELASLTGARMTTVAGPSDAAAALERVLES